MPTVLALDITSGYPRDTPNIVGTISGTELYLPTQVVLTWGVSSSQVIFQTPEWTAVNIYFQMPDFNNITDETVVTVTILSPTTGVPTTALYTITVYPKLTITPSRGPWNVPQQISGVINPALAQIPTSLTFGSTTINQSGDWTTTNVYFTTPTPVSTDAGTLITVAITGTQDASYSSLYSAILTPISGPIGTVISVAITPSIDINIPRALVIRNSDRTQRVDVNVTEYTVNSASFTMPNEGFLANGYIGNVFISIVNCNVMNFDVTSAPAVNPVYYAPSQSVYCFQTNFRGMGNIGQY